LKERKKKKRKKEEKRKHKKKKITTVSPGGMFRGSRGRPDLDQSLVVRRKKNRERVLDRPPHAEEEKIRGRVSARINKNYVAPIL